MKDIELLGSFRTDLKRIKKRDWDRKKLDLIVTMLRESNSLPISARAHKLAGEWLGFRECHVAPNWLLIYDTSDTTVLLTRAGTHVDLFE